MNENETTEENKVCTEWIACEKCHKVFKFYTDSKTLKNAKKINGLMPIGICFHCTYGIPLIIFIISIAIDIVLFVCELGFKSFNKTVENIYFIIYLLTCFSSFISLMKIKNREPEHIIMNN